MNMKNLIQLLQSRNTWLWVIGGIVIAILYMLVFGISLLHFINGLTLAFAILLLIGMIVHGYKNAEFSFWTYHIDRGETFQEYKARIRKQRQGSNYPLFASIILGIIALIVQLFY